MDNAPRLVSNSSIAGRVGFPFTEAYAASKDGLIAFGRVLRNDYRKALIALQKDQVDSIDYEDAAVVNSTQKVSETRATLDRIEDGEVEYIFLAPEQLKSNLLALIEALNKAKPAGTKGVYLRKISVSSTMGAGVRVDTASVTTQAAQA